MDVRRKIELPRRLIDLKNKVLASRHFWSFSPLPVREYGMFSRFEPIWVQPRPRTAGSAGMRGSGEYSGHVDRLPPPTRATLKASGHVRGWSKRGTEWNPASFLVLRRRLQVKFKLTWVSLGKQKNAYSGVFVEPRLLLKGRAIASAVDLTSRRIILICLRMAASKS
ncbi:hypothetical protein ACDY97_01350 [Rhizobium mongolense]